MKRDAPLLLTPTPTEQPISLDVLREKYLKADEQTVGDLYARVAKALASVEALDARAEWEARFLANLNAGAIGAGRIMSAAGAGIEATLINCFVQPVGDCIQGTDAEGYPGIYEALREAAETMRRGGGVGYDFSRIRPKGAEVKGTASLASGPCSYINVFDQSCSTVESAGARRGAQMGVLRIDHPDVLDFITAKRSPGRWNNFNVSVAVTDAFMQALAAGQTWELVHLPSRARLCWARVPASATMASGCTAACPLPSCGTPSCARPTTSQSPASCSWTTSTRTTTCGIASRFPQPTHVVNSHCLLTVVVTWGRSS